MNATATVEFRSLSEPEQDSNFRNVRVLQGDRIQSLWFLQDTDEGKAALLVLGNLVAGDEIAVTFFHRVKETGKCSLRLLEVAYVYRTDAEPNAAQEAQAV